MARRGWFDRQTQRAPVVGDVSGLVLSGGGARASFHIGALRYLYDVVGIAPTRIVGTSAGSIVGAMLAQSLDRDVQAAELRELERHWLGMQTSADMFAEQAWFTRLRSHWDELSGITGLLAGHDEAHSVVSADADEVESVVRAAMEEDPSQDMIVTPNDLWQLASSLLRVGRAGAGLAASVRGAERAASAYRPGPIVQRLLFESSFKASRVVNSGVALRLAFVDLNSGALRFMRQDGVIVDRDDVPIAPARHDLTLGVWASCALPGIFRPVKLGDEVYVDGGARENVPVEMAVAHLGVTKPYVVVASPPGVARDDFAAKDMMAVLLRVATISMDEIIQDEVEWARRSGAMVIEPHVNVHDAWMVEPGLLHINRDYGWMRAAEEVTGASAEVKEVNESIVRARCEWAASVQSTWLPSVTPPGLTPRHKRTKGEVKEIQHRLHELLARADDALLPPGHETWDDHLF